MKFIIVTFTHSVIHLVSHWVHGLLFLELLTQLKMKIFSTGEISDDGRFTFEKYFVCLFQYLSYWESDKSDFFWHDIFL